MAQVSNANPSPNPNPSPSPSPNAWRRGTSRCRPPPYISRISRPSRANLAHISPDQVYFEVQAGHALRTWVARQAAAAAARYWACICLRAYLASRLRRWRARWLGLDLGLGVGVRVGVGVGCGVGCGSGSGSAFGFGFG